MLRMAAAKNHTGKRVRVSDSTSDDRLKPGLDLERVGSYVQINARARNWAESVVFSKHRELCSQGIESYVFWARGKHEQDEHMMQIATFPESCVDALQTRFDGKMCFHSKGITARLLKKLEEIDPDVVHLHDLLGYYLNVEILFNWLMKHRCHVVWTLHDCWAFTGHCIHFSNVGCYQWETRCSNEYPCPQLETYPPTFCGKTVGWNFDQKKRLFTMLPIERMSLVTPSMWLADLVSRSFLAKYPVSVIPNRIDLSTYKPTMSDFRCIHGLEDEFIILGVSSAWSDRKGLCDFLRLADDLDDSYAVVIIGLSGKQIRQLRKNGSKRLTLLPKTDTPDDLVKAYTAADVFFNPTKEDNFPTVNLEAEACGTPVITYDVGGCKETLMLPDSRCVLRYDDGVRLIKTMRKIADSRNAS